MTAYHCRKCRRHGLSTPEASRIFHSMRTPLFDLDGCLSIVEMGPAIVVVLIVIGCCGCFAWKTWF